VTVTEADCSTILAGCQCGTLDGDPGPANLLVKRDNPDMSDALIANAIAAMKRHGIVVSGDALTLGIGAMTDACWKDFFDTMSGAGVFPPTLEYRQAYTLQFVKKKVGMK